MQAPRLDLLGQLDRPDGLIGHEHGHTESQLRTLPQLRASSPKPAINLDAKMPPAPGEARGHGVSQIGGVLGCSAVQRDAGVYW